MNRDRTVVVTGGAGFVGRPLARRLVDDGWSVAVLDDFSAGTRELAATAFRGIPVSMIEADVADHVVVSATLKGLQPSIVFHLAAIHFIPQCDAHPEKALRTNVIGTQAVLSAVSTVPGCRFVFASTGDVYAPSTEPHHEASPASAITLYGLTKHTSEQLIERLAPQGLDYRIARLFNVYGPGDLTPHVLPDILAGLSQSDVLALGRLDAVRDYVYVDDVVDALVLIAKHEGRDRVFNVGTGTGRSVQAILDTMSIILDKPIRVETDPRKARPVERPSLVCDRTRISQAVGWQPCTSFADGLRSTLAFYQDNTVRS